MTAEIIDGRFKVIKTLVGGMGVIHLCLDSEQNDYPVALKMIKPDFLPNPDARRKFLREANIWIQVGLHPNILRALKVEYLPETHETYIVTELIQTPRGLPDASLNSWILAGNINLSRGINFGLHIIRGMKYATSQIPDLVHRDLKPGNILIGPDEIAKVNDFGISSSVQGGAPADINLSGINPGDKTHSFIGTPNYMSPEQCKAQPLDCRSDIYSYGLILFELLTGQPVITGPDIHQVVLYHINGHALNKAKKDIRDVNLKTFVMKCVHPEIKERYQDWSEVENAFKQVYKTILGENPPEEEYPIDISLYGFYQKAGSYLALGASYTDVGDYKMAESFSQKALECAQKIAAPRLEADALDNLGIISSKMGQYEKAVKYLEFSLKIYFKLYDLANQAINLGNLGNAYQRLGKIEKARDFFVQSLTIAKSEKLVGIEASQLGNLAVSFAEQGNFQNAIKLYNQAIEILASRHAEVALSTNYSNLANVYLLMGDLITSESILKKALELAVKNGVKPQQCIILGNLANVFVAKGQLPKALEILSDAVNLSNDIGDKRGLCLQLATIASIFSKQKRFKEARDYLNNALSIAEALKDTRSLGTIHFAVGNLCIERGNLNDAIPAFQKCIDVSLGINDRYTEATAYGNLGKVYAALFNFDQAIICLEKSMEIAEEIGTEDVRGRASWTLGVIYELTGRIDKAIQSMKYAVQIFKKYQLADYEQASIHFEEVKSGVKSR